MRRMRLRKLLWATRTFAGFAWENQVARWLPNVHDRMKRAGRAERPGDAKAGQEGADYFCAVAADYEVIAEASGVVERGADLWRGRRVLELGPGDTRSIGLLARARGAVRWDGVDAFDVESRDEGYRRAIYTALARHEGLEPSRVDELLHNTRICKQVSELPRGEADLVVSRSVLEHVHDLDALFRAIAETAHPRALHIHKVDLRCHGTRFDHELDFLMFPERVYGLMASHLDLPNRARAPELLRAGPQHGLTLVWASKTHVLELEEVSAVRRRLPRELRRHSDAELTVLGLWLVLVGREHPLAGKGKRWTVADLPLAPFDRLSRY